MKLALKYVLFAMIATAANLLAQDFSLKVYSAAYDITISILVGTAVGLVIKYVLDKKYIFRFQVRDVKHDSKTFFLYSVMGLVTTAIFWGFEAGFELMFHDKTMRFVGAVIGLAIGYFVKYLLDRKYVFK